MQCRNANALTGRKQSTQQVGSDRIDDGGAQRGMASTFERNVRERRSGKRFVCQQILLAVDLTLVSIIDYFVNIDFLPRAIQGF
jgi:hypothetical protein